MTANIQLTTAYLNGAIVTSLLYGICFVLSCGSIYVLCFKRRSERINYTLLSGITVQFVLITIHYGIAWNACYQAFIQHGDTPRGPLLFYSAVDKWWDVASSTLGLATILVGDGMFINRVYVVWDHKFIPCVLPFILMIGSLTSGVGVLVEISRPTATTYATRLSQWIIAYLSINLAQNMLSTLLIIGRIWRLYIPTPSFTTAHGVWSLIVVLLESGALYSATVLVFVILYACRNNAAITMGHIYFPILCITFNLIIVRVGLGLSKVGPAYHSEWMSRWKTSAFQVFRPAPTVSKLYPLDSIADTLPQKSPTVYEKV